MAGKTNRETAQQEFRKFAWNLAGTLAKTKPVAAKPGKR
jgi:thymidylate synthase ThyX